MGRIRKKSQGGRSAAKRSAATVNASASIFVAGPIDFAVRYAEACGLAVQGRSDEARRTYLELDSGLALAAGEVRLRALVRNDLAALAALEGRVDEALAGWRAALEIDPDCLMARLNRDLIEAALSFGQMGGDVGELKLGRHRCLRRWWGKVARRAGWGAEAAWQRRTSSRAELWLAHPPWPPLHKGGKFACGWGWFWSRCSG